MVVNQQVRAEEEPVVLEGPSPFPFAALESVAGVDAAFGLVAEAASVVAEVIVELRSSPYWVESVLAPRH